MQNLRQIVVRLTAILTLCTFILGSQAHWALVQIGAWGSMLIERSPEQGIEAAIESTFSGNSPCCLCKLVEEAATSTNENAPTNKAPLREIEFEGKLSALLPADYTDAGSKDNDPGATFTRPGSEKTPSSALSLLDPPPPRA